MKIDAEKFSKSVFPFIDDSSIDKIIPIAYGRIAAIGAVCINKNQNPDNPDQVAVYRLPIGTSNIGTAFVKVGDVWRSAAVVSVDYESGLLTLSNGRESSGVSRELKLTNCQGFTFSGHSYPKDVLAHFFENYGNVKYDASNFDITEFETELATIASDIGFVIQKEVDFWEFVYEISCKCEKLFRVDYTNDGKVTARIKDFDRPVLSDPMPSCEIINSHSLPIKTDKSGIYSGVICRYARNYVDDVFLSVLDTTYEVEVKQKYKKFRRFELETFLYYETDAAARAYEDATRLADAPLVVELEVFQRQDLRLFDVVTVSIQPDNLDSTAREYAGNRDCMILSISQTIDGMINKPLALIINRRAPSIPQTAVLSGSYDTIEREKSTLEIVQDDFAEEVAKNGVLQLTSPSTPNGEYDYQIGMYQGDLYQWQNGVWVKIEAIYPNGEPVIRFDFDSLTISEGEYTKPIIDNSGNGNDSVFIRNVVPV